jgi:hypothetical protein
MNNVANDIETKQREERQTLREDAEDFQSLIAHKAWTKFLRLIDRVAQNHHGAVMKPVESLLEMPRIEFAKGVLSGLSLAATLPQMKINEARELLPPQPYEEN